MKLREVDAHAVGRPKLHRLNTGTVQASAALGSKGGVGLHEYEVFRQPLYDYYQAAVGQKMLQQQMFSIAQNQDYTPVGGTAFQKTILHTNCDGAASQGFGIPSPGLFIAKQMFMLVQENIWWADFWQLKYTCMLYVIMTADKKHYWDGQIAQVPSGGAGTTGIGTPASNATLLNNGWPTSQNKVSFSTGSLIADPLGRVSPDSNQNDPLTGLALVEDPGLVLEQGMPWSVTIDPNQLIGGAFSTTGSGPGGTGVIFWDCMDGDYLR